MAITEQLRGLAILAATDGRSELYGGELLEKPPMSWGHNEAMRSLTYQLINQLDRRAFQVYQDHGHLLVPRGNSYIPDVAVVPVALQDAFRSRPNRFEAYDEPLPFVVEIWSPSTGGYDIDSKLPDYRARGDEEIWRLQPFAKTLSRWLRQPDGSYREETWRGGKVRLHALPDVVIDLDELFIDE